MAISHKALKQSGRDWDIPWFDTTMPSTRAGSHRGVGILDRLDALEYDGAVPVLAQEREVFPSAERARVGLLQPPCAEGERLARLHVSRRETRAERVQVERERGARAAAAVRLLSVHEDRVGLADLRADAHGEG